MTKNILKTFEAEILVKLFKNIHPKLKNYFENNVRL